MKRISKTILTGLAALAVGVSLVGCAREQSPVIFDTPEAAVLDLADLIRQGDVERMEQVFGPGSLDVLLSGDDEADREDYARVEFMIGEGVAFEELDENTRIALFGDVEWPLPIPLVRDGEGWKFSLADGREELLNRRVGRNELWTLTTLHEIVDAQQEYHDLLALDGVFAYAQRFRSSEGQRDGLYWPVEAGDDPSPLGEWLAGSEDWSDDPRPFHGYFYRILTRRGADAPGGALDYLDESGLLSRGYGIVAWPATYGNSGVMTFITDQRGLVYQKDLGGETGVRAAVIESFNPDSSWTPTEDSLLEVEE
jgi:hypothetical protein